MPLHRLPKDLTQPLRAARRVEATAVGTDQRRAAVYATARLLLAALAADWRAFDLAPPLGITAGAVRSRISSAQRGKITGGGLEVD